MVDRKRRDRSACTWNRRVSGGSAAVLIAAWTIACGSDNGTAGAGAASGSGASAGDAGVAGGAGSGGSGGLAGGAGSGGSGGLAGGAGASGSSGSAGSSGAAGGPSGPSCRSVAIGGGGYVTGLFAHPTAPNLVYIRTDVGGFYRWDPTGERWVALNDAFAHNEKQSQRGLGLALDPSNPDLVYIAGGWGAGGKIYKSTDRGTTWVAVHTLYIQGNEEHRWTGERLAVDPNDPSVVLFGSQQDGLQVSKSGGASWSKAAGIPNGTAPVGVNSLGFDPSSPGRVVAASRGSGVYVSTDHGDSFSLIAGSPNDVNRLAVAGDGTVYVTRSSGASRFRSGEWNTLSPSAPSGFNSLAVDPENPGHVLIAEHGQWVTRLLRSTDHGTTWKQLAVKKVSTVPWWPDAYFANWSASLMFDPTVPGRVWQSDWFGVWRTEDVTAAETSWTAYEEGHEEVVVHDLLSRQSGSELVSGVADVGGFDHASIDAYPTESLGKSDDTYVHDNYALASDPADPMRVIRVGGNRADAQSWGFISADGAMSWKAMAGAPAGKIARRVVHSAPGSKSLLVIDDDGQPYWNADGSGSAWTGLAGLPQQGPYGPWVSAERACADGAKPSTYYYVHGTTLFATESGGAFQTRSSSLPATSSSVWDYVSLVATPGVAEDLWLGIEKVGLFHLTGSSFTATPVGGFTSVFWVTFGKEAPGTSTPTLFVSGVKGGVAGLYRSTDLGASFLNVTDPARRVILRGKLEGSWQTFGRVFVGYGGRGIFACEAP